eukprot:717791-Prymnesium_polylepis.2
MRKRQRISPSGNLDAIRSPSADWSSSISLFGMVTMLRPSAVTSRTCRATFSTARSHVAPLSYDTSTWSSGTGIGGCWGGCCGGGSPKSAPSSVAAWLDATPGVRFRPPDADAAARLLPPAALPPAALPPAAPSPDVLSSRSSEATLMKMGGGRSKFFDGASRHTRSSTSLSPVSSAGEHASEALARKAGGGRVRELLRTVKDLASSRRPHLALAHGQLGAVGEMQTDEPVGSDLLVHLVVPIVDERDRPVLAFHVAHLTAVQLVPHCTEQLEHIMMRWLPLGFVGLQHLLALRHRNTCPCLGRRSSHRQRGIAGADGATNLEGTSTHELPHICCAAHAARCAALHHRRGERRRRPLAREPAANVALTFDARWLLLARSLALSLALLLALLLTLPGERHVPRAMLRHAAAVVGRSTRVARCSSAGGPRARATERRVKRAE